MKIFLGMAILLITLMISGCNSSNTDKVKNGIMDFDKSITVSQAFDNWKSCNNGVWSEFVTDNGKNMVEFTCQATDYQKYIGKSKSIYSKLAEEDKIIKQEEKKKSIAHLARVQAVIDAGGTDWDSERRISSYKTAGTVKNIQNTIENFKKDSAIDEKIISEILNIKLSNYTIQWIVNMDDTFEINHFGLETEWNDSKKYSKNLSVMNALNKVYLNESLLSYARLNEIDEHLDEIKVRLKEKYKSQYSSNIIRLKNKLLEDVFINFDYRKAK